MSLYLDDGDVQLYHGDVRQILPRLPDASVDCVATSPPFYALRDYGVEGQIGLEATPEQWAQELVGVFRECRRVLKDTGTLWVECGDSYAAQGGGKAAGQYEGKRIAEADWQPPRTPTGGYKPKDLLGTPWLLAFALRADGWYLRQAIIWHKPNAMPESVTDRCTTAHSYVFLFSKRPRYWFDAEAIAEDGAGRLDLGRMKQAGRIDAQRWHNDGEHKQEPGRNPRSVWTVPTQGYPEAHFATWPETLCERIIKAGCPEGGTILDPFGGSGTTAHMARKLGRRAILVELNESYCELAARRLQQLSLLAIQGRSG